MTSISVRMDGALKASFEATCEDIGIPMQVAIIVFAKRVARDRKIPFDLSAPRDPSSSERHIRFLEEMDQQYQRE